MELSNIKDQLKNISPADLATGGVIVPARTKANGELTYICPTCGNGSGKTGDGLAVEKYSWGYNFRCFKCGQNFDVIRLLALHYSLDTRADFAEILKRAAADFGLTANFSEFEQYHNLKPVNFIPPPLREKTPAEIEKERKDMEETLKEIEIIKQDIKFAQDHLKELPLDQNNTWRGLTLDTLQHFYCGYIEYWTSPKARLKGVKTATPTPRVIIPSGKHYLARLTVPLETFKDAPDFQYIKAKPHAGQKGIFGIDTICQKTVQKPLAQVSEAKKQFICTIDTDNSDTPRRRTFTADLKSFSVAKRFYADTEPLANDLPVATIVEIKGVLPKDKQKIFVPTANKLTFDLSADNETQIAVENFSGETIKKQIPFKADCICIDKIDSLQPAAPPPESIARLIVEFKNSETHRLSLPPDTRTITLERSMVDSGDEELPDFLKYTLKIFETTHFKKIDDDEDNSAPVEKTVTTDFVYVFEGEIDAMSAWQALHSDNPNFAFIATSGASETNWVNIVDVHCKRLGIKPRFAVVFDNDDAGKTNAPLRVLELQKLGYPARFSFLGGETNNG